jgi:protein-glutamine gamma-glutamyltransferase
MTFSSYFRVSSYAMVACGTLCLAVSGGMGLGLTIGFTILMAVAWMLEDGRWQLSERVGLVVVLLSLPLFYLDWQFLTGGSDVKDRVGVSALAHLILFLSAVKLLQKKADRDWVFLYLISFFEVLLAAGLSLSPLFLVTLGLYMLFALSTVISLEIRKARRGLKVSETRLLVAPDSTLFRRLRKGRARRQFAEARRLPLVALILLLMIFVLAMPLFFIAPRFGSSALTRSGEGLGGVNIGFSDKVSLGEIGRLQQNDQVVMRVRVEDTQAKRRRNLRWRGVALDQFNGHEWQRTSRESAYVPANSERNFFQLGTTEGLHRLTTQTFFVEPIDTPVLFAAPRAVALQGALPYVRKDREDALTTRRHDLERISYIARSDTEEPEADVLRDDAEAYGQEFERYLQRPETLDPRIATLAREMIAREGARNRYDKARAIEARLQQDYGYTLELKAGGEDPLADFLFRVREGHCEYFSTSMAVMLRTQGIAARVVNGFQMGEYNETADAYTVTQSDAHSWVEVYFPATGAWVTFDPTPAAGRPLRQSTGLSSRLSKYAEALELLWIQYVVSYDKQEQRSLATSLRNRLGEYRRLLAQKFEALKAAISEWLRAVEGADGSASGWSPARLGLLLALASILLVLPLALLVRRIKRLGLRRGLLIWRAVEEEERDSVIEFYERMTTILAARGLRREPDETPLEFATAAGMPEVLKITEAYNRVRYGEQALLPAEVAEIEKWLRDMEDGNRSRRA